MAVPAKAYVAPTALGEFIYHEPDLTDRANFCRAYGIREAASMKATATKARDEPKEGEWRTSQVLLGVLLGGTGENLRGRSSAVGMRHEMTAKEGAQRAAF